MVRFIKNDLPLAADTLGKPMHGQWVGCRVVHTYNDRWRVVWEPHPGLGTAIVLMVGRRFDTQGRPLYDRPRPMSGL